MRRSQSQWQDTTADSESLDDGNLAIFIAAPGRLSELHSTAGEHDCVAPHPEPMGR
jgi:hypothetical protein